MPRDGCSQPSVASASTCLQEGPALSVGHRPPTRRPRDVAEQAGYTDGGEKPRGTGRGGQDPSPRSYQTTQSTRQLLMGTDSNQPGHGGTPGDRTQALTAGGRKTRCLAALEETGRNPCCVRRGFEDEPGEERGGRSPGGAAETTTKPLEGGQNSRRGRALLHEGRRGCRLTALPSSDQRWS